MATQVRASLPTIDSHWFKAHGQQVDVTIETLSEAFNLQLLPELPNPALSIVHRFE